MLHEFLTTNQEELIERCRAKVGLRLAPTATASAVKYGIPRFLAQLIRTLEIEETSEPLRSLEVSGAGGG
ncbi:MAG TPA: sensor histidine kinase, partial [Burkholderiales bacterium]|nr:sensor histidine kinase [Burkholderiales bacterium]